MGNDSRSLTHVRCRCTTSSGLVSFRQSTTAEICAVSSSAGRILHDPKQKQTSQNNSNKYDCTIGQELVDTAVQVLGRHCVVTHQVAALFCMK